MTGECDFTRIGDQLVIDRADQQVWIAPEFLDAIYPVGIYPNPKLADKFFQSRFFPNLGAEFPNPWFQLERNDHTHDDDCGARLGQLCYRGWLLRINASNRTVIYQITSYLRDENVWQAIWPD